LTKPHQHRQRIDRGLGEAVLEVEGFGLFINRMAQQRTRADQLCGLAGSQHCILEQAAADAPSRPVAVHSQ